jgi:hypothetical protein
MINQTVRGPLATPDGIDACRLQAWAALKPGLPSWYHGAAPYWGPLCVGPGPLSTQMTLDRLALSGRLIALHEYRGWLPVRVPSEVGQASGSGAIFGR